MILVVLVTVLVLGIAGYGIMSYLRSSEPAGKQDAKKAVHEMESVEGLHIVNGAGSMEPNGDLVISGEIANTTDKERTAWAVAVDVYDAQGGVLAKIRMVNGKQIFTRKDYEVMARRGDNVQELKTKLLQEQGTPIPAKGTLNFAIRCIQPPVGVASFNAQVIPFDPVQLYKELADEMKS